MLKKITIVIVSILILAFIGFEIYFFIQVRKTFGAMYNEVLVIKDFLGKSFPEQVKVYGSQQ